MKALLALEDGFALEGETFAGSGEAHGQVAFNTNVVGYQEILTDPSCKGLLVTMTYPLIGNYGVNEEDFESTRPWAEAIIVREYSQFYSSWRASSSLREFLEKYGIIGLEGLDTRALVRHIREKGEMRGVISTEDLNPKRLLEKARDYPGLEDKDLVKEVTCKEKYIWEKDPNLDKSHSQPYPVAVIDLGVKYSFLRLLFSHNCHITVLPAFSKKEEILRLNPKGIILSSGPGDPRGLDYLVETIKGLKDEVPLLGIGLGHQILAHAFGLDTGKLKFGHRGGNQPVRDLKTGRVEITAQNHGFCVKMVKDFPKDLLPTHLNLNDGTLEGLEHRELPIFSLEYYPIGSLEDPWSPLSKFIGMMRR